MTAHNPAILEPFGSGRELGRLLHDVGLLLSCMREPLRAEAVLDLGAGSGWVTEFLARAGWRVTALDTHPNLDDCLNLRAAADSRLDRSMMRAQQGDGHLMPFGDRAFGHVVCFDSLHHMHDFDRVFAEMARVLQPGGRAIFVEPGARHSSSPQTIEFLASNPHDETWIERDIVLEEVNEVAARAGFSTMQVVPAQHPFNMITMSLGSWQDYRANSASIERIRMTEYLAGTNYNDRVVFYFDR